MSTIACDGEILAADTQMSSDYIDAIEFKKIFKVEDGFYAGFAGECRVIVAVVEWLRGGDRPDVDKDADLTALLIRNGSGYTMEAPFFKEYPIALPAAAGSGSVFAIGAMDAGASAREAVEIAIRRDLSTGGKVRWMRIG